MITIPLKINEAANGTMFVMLGFSALFFALYLLRAKRESGGRRWRVVIKYDDNKTALALFTVLTGAAVKDGALWWALFFRIHGGEGKPALVTMVFLVGSMITIWGLICLMRTLSHYDWNRWAWAFLAMSAVVFGIASVYF